MSRTSIELSTLAQPAATAKGPSLRRPSSSHTSVRFSHDHDQYADTVPLPGLELSRTDTVTSASRTTVIIASVTLITAISALLNGLTTVALPTMAKELGIPASLLLWPSSIQALTHGCTLLIAGSIADAVGARLMYLVGCILQAGFILGCGLSKTSGQIILFRGLSGIALSFCLPSAVAIITHSFVGKRRDFAFASMGGGQPIGFALGLALGGVLTDSIGWRWGFYISAILDAAIFAVALWGLPKAIDFPAERESERELGWKVKWERVRDEIDWIGAVIASLSLAMLSYVFATITGSTASIKQPLSITLLVVAFALIPVFIYWVGRQESRGKPAIIPNSLWRNQAFTTICISVFLIWGAFNAVETILTFYFQDVQNLSATKTSIYFLPAPVSGVISNVIVGFIVHKVKAHWLVLGGCTISTLGPLVMTFAKVDSLYWSHAFLSNVFNPVGADSLYTVANLLITSVFPPRTHGLAGGVFNTVAQIGRSVGLTLVAVIAASVTRTSKYKDKESPEALLKGYNATFWFCFAQVCLVCVLAVFGLRKAGRVGHKRD